MIALSVLALTALLALPSCAHPAAPPRAEGGAPPPAAAAEEFDQTHALWAAVLKAHVHDDRFDYAKLKAQPEQLDQYLKTLAGVQPEELAAWTREQRYAFWINAYNAFTVKKVVSNYPLKSIKDLDGALGLKSVFDDDFIALRLHPEGKDAGPSPKEGRLSLNDIENGILRPTFKDARVHAAINCASISCPALSAEAFVAEKLDKQLDARMRAFLADARRNRFDAEKGRAEVSEVFKWFKEDFERDAGGVREFLLRFAPKEAQELLKSAKLEHLDYDWSLNDVERK